MVYSLAKAAHLIALFVWIAGMVAVAVSLRTPVRDQLASVRSYDQSVTSPAMIAAWGLGPFLAWQGGWVFQPWPWMKFAMVLALSGIHGVLSGRLRRYAHADDELAPIEAAHLWLGFALLVSIVTLVTIKP